jgi:hypothetical protein
MGFFGNVLGAAAAAVQTVIRVTADVASTAARIVRVEYKRLRERYRNIDVPELKDQRLKEINQINEEIIELERKQRYDGRLNEYEQQRLNELCRQRDELRTRVDNAKEFETAGRIAENEDQFAAKVVDSENPNEITRLGGQVIMGKLCERCQRPMSIRWRTDVRNPGINDLFWSCTGFFIRSDNGTSACRCTIPFSIHDREIFGNVSLPGMELPTERLTEIVLNPATSQRIKGRLRYAVHEATDDYLCPVHHEKMQLKEKRSPEDILDLYYLSCPRCDQTFKIKSPTQLDALLESFLGKGLFD